MLKSNFDTMAISSDKSTIPVLGKMHIISFGKFNCMGTYSSIMPL